jgi:hypothetical protein
MRIVCCPSLPRYFPIPVSRLDTTSFARTQQESHIWPLCVAVILGVRPVIALPSFLWRRRLENLHFTIRTAKLGPTALSKVGFKIRQEGEMGMTSSRTMHDAKRAEGSTWMQETKFSDWSGE